MNAVQPATDQCHRVAGLLEITEAIHSEPDFKSLLKTLARRTAQLCGADRCSVYLWRDGMLEPAMSQYASGATNPEMWHSFKVLGALHLDQVKGFKRALEEGHPVVIEDPAHSDLLPREWVDMFRIRSGLVFPLSREQRFVGVMHLNNCDSALPFGPSDVELAGAIAGQLALVIDNARLVEETQRRLRDTETLLAVGHVVSSTLDVNELVRRVARAVARALDADSSGIFLRDDDGGLRPVAGYQIPVQLLDVLRSERLLPGTLERVGSLLGDGRPCFWSADVPNDPRFDHPLFARFPVQSLLVTSLQAKDELIGLMVCAWWRRRRRFAEAELELVEGIARQAAIAIVNARLYEKAEELAVNRERVRVAQDLHDRLSQTVFSLGLRLEWCLHHVGGDGSVRRQLEDVRLEAGSIMTQMRDVVAHLSADRVPAASLSARLRKLVDDFGQLSGIVPAYVETGDLASVGRRGQEVLFKALQEALANVAKHARASRVSLTVTVADGTVAFEIGDDGIGPPPGFAALPGTFATPGLRQMVERVESLRGRISFGPGPTGGFAISGALPTRDPR